MEPKTKPGDMNGNELNSGLPAGIGRMIEYVRMLEKMSQVDFARAIETTQSRLSILETGKELPRMSTILRIANIFGYKIHIKFVREEKHTVLDSEGMYRWNEYSYNWSLWPPRDQD